MWLCCWKTTAPTWDVRYCLRPARVGAAVRLRDRSDFCLTSWSVCSALINSQELSCALLNKLTREDWFTEKMVGTGLGAASQGRQKQLPSAASPGGPGGLTADVVPRIRIVPEGVLCLIGAMVQTFCCILDSQLFAKSSALQLASREGGAVSLPKQALLVAGRLGRGPHSPGGDRPHLTGWALEGVWGAQL